MQRILIDEPYEFIPPYRGTLFASVCKLFLNGYLRRSYGLMDYECRGTDRLKASLRAGHGIILAPNHCRPSDPMVMGLITKEANTHIHSMASWHIFKQDRITAFLVRRLGAFSIYREGMDRTALNCAIDLLCEARRPLVIFPEGVISRTNDRLGALMEGTSFIARTAARRRQKANSEAQTVIHPVALKYKFLGDVEAAIRPVLDDIEGRLSWRPQQQLSCFERIAKLGFSLLCLKEIEYLGSPQRGPVYKRLQRLINHLLEPIEIEWLGEPQSGDAVQRVKRLRSAILPDMVGKELSEDERQRRWQLLEDVYLAQQLWFYPPDYVRPNSAPERLLETIERFEEDLTDAARTHGNLKVYIDIGEAIVVSPQRERGVSGDPLMQNLENQLKGQLEALSQELDPAR